VTVSRPRTDYPIQSPGRADYPRLEYLVRLSASQSQGNFPSRSQLKIKLAYNKAIDDPRGQFV